MSTATEISLSPPATLYAYDAAPFSIDEYSWLIRDFSGRKGLDPTCRTIINTMFGRTKGKDKKVYADYPRIQDDCGIPSRQTVADHLDHLEFDGWLHIEHGNGNRNDYTPLVPFWVVQILDGLKEGFWQGKWSSIKTAVVQNPYYWSPESRLLLVQKLDAKRNRKRNPEKDTTKRNPDFEQSRNESFSQASLDAPPLVDFDLPVDEQPAVQNLDPSPRKITPYHLKPKSDERQYYRNDRTRKVVLGPIASLPASWQNDDISEFWLNQAEVRNLKAEGRMHEYDE